MKFMFNIKLINEEINFKKKHIPVIIENIIYFIFSCHSDTLLFKLFRKGFEDFLELSDLKFKLEHKIWI